jgi:glycosyltransferase involved in cell wall biosynthesis
MNAPCSRPRALFIVPWYLFPANTGGRIRTRDILRGMKGGRYEITLVSPEPEEGAARGAEIESVCDRFVGWPSRRRGPMFAFTRLRYLVLNSPVSVATDWSAPAQRVIDAALATRPDVAVVDFAHTAVFAPRRLAVPSVLFTHNVEAQIFKRHADVATNSLVRAVWKNQWAKMMTFERAALSRFDGVVAVSERDREIFARDYGIENNVHVIPTGVDLDYFSARPQAAAESGSETLVFTGSMDWMPNIDAIEFFMDEIWPLIIARRPQARAIIVGRTPPPRLVEQAKRRRLAIEFTGRVEDVRPYVHGAHVYVIPLRVGGGTRLKVFEAMAMGCPMVSTGIGVEGLPLERDKHYLLADTASDFAKAVVKFLEDPGLRAKVAQAARAHVADNFSSKGVATAFEDICVQVAGAAGR